MKYRPILFSGPMVRALLAGTKTQMRRIVKMKPFDPCDETLHAHALVNIDRCPYGVVGDRLWVRERINRETDPMGDPMHSYYDADDTYTVADAWPWKRDVLPSIHCPRGLSRITLEITGVRVERLQEISEEDAKAEGLTGISKDGTLVKYGIPDADGLPGNDDHGWHWQEWDRDPRVAYRTLWERINGPGSWEVNPWVWVLEFKRMEQEATP